MTAIRQSACSVWATTDDLCSPCDDYELDSALMDDWLAVATDLLYEFSGHRWPGSCSDTVRPCGGLKDMDGWCGCRAADDCGCGGLQQVDLGTDQLTAITEVLVDGAAVPETSYRIDDWKWLVRTDGETWPCCQRLERDSTEDETFEVAFTYGFMPPTAGVKAAAALACELYLSCQPELTSRCRLSSRVSSITRQGVSMVLLSPAAGGILEEVKAALPEVGLFLAAYNPGNIRRPLALFSPDIGPEVRRVST